MRLPKFHELTKPYVHHRYRVLFYSLLLTFAASPVLAASGLPTDLLQFFLGMNLVFVLFADRKLRSSQLFCGFLLLTMLGRAIATTFHIEAVALALLPVLGIFALGTVGVVLMSALRTERITDETLYAALSAYLIAGLCMAFTYWSIEQAEPLSFIISDAVRIKSFSIATAVYFSFVTLATVGYGDIIPNSELTRGLVIFQSVAGQLYLVVMVARLVSLYRARGEGEGNR